MELPRLSNPNCAICRQPITHPSQEATVQTICTKQPRRVHRDCIEVHVLSIRRLETIPGTRRKN